MIVLHSTTWDSWIIKLLLSSFPLQEGTLFTLGINHKALLNVAPALMRCTTGWFGLWGGGARRSLTGCQSGCWAAVWPGGHNGCSHHSLGPRCTRRRGVVDNGKSKAGRTLLRKGWRSARGQGAHTRINKWATPEGLF